MSVEIIHDAVREAATGGAKAYTFTVDGHSSGFWSRTRPAIERVITRLKLGRSREAFGGTAVVQAGEQPAVKALHKDDKSARAKIVKAGEVTIETITMKSGRTKPRERQPGFVVEVDGQPLKQPDGSERIVTSDGEAKQLAAFKAFMTRGKLNKIAEAERAFKDQFGKACKIHCTPETGHRLIAKDQDGNLWHVGLNAGPDGDRVKFVLLMPAAPKG